MAYEIVDPFGLKDWNNKVAAAKEATVFHSSNWAKLLNESYSYKPVYFVEKSGEEVSSVLPAMNVSSYLTGRRGVSLPFTDYCRPIVGASSEPGEMIKKVLDYGREQRWRYYELRDSPAPAEGAPVYRQFYGHRLSLEAGEEKLTGAFAKNARRNISKAERENVTVTFSDSLEAMLKFFNMHCMTRQRHGVPPPPWRFFRNLHKNVISEGLGTVAIAHHEDRPVAAGVVLTFGKYACLKYEASDEASLTIGANHMLVYRIILHLCSGGFHVFSFGRTDADNDGLRRFKTSWGAVEGTIDYYRFDYHKNVYVAASGQDCDEKWRRFFMRMPQPMFKLVGSILYEHVA